MNFGTDFMTDSSSLEMPKGKRGPKKTLMTRSIMNPDAAQPEWDEAQSEDANGRVTLDQCGKLEEIDSENEGERSVEAVQRVVKVGRQQYTLVLRGKTLDISGNTYRRQLRRTLIKEPCPLDPAIQAWMSSTHIFTST